MTVHLPVILIFRATCFGPEKNSCDIQVATMKPSIPPSLTDHVLFLPVSMLRPPSNGYRSNGYISIYKLDSPSTSVTFLFYFKSIFTRACSNVVSKGTSVTDQALPKCGSLVLFRDWLAQFQGTFEHSIVLGTGRTRGNSWIRTTWNS